MIYLPLLLIYPISVYANNIYVWVWFFVFFVIWTARCLRSVSRFP